MTFGSCTTHLIWLVMFVFSNGRVQLLFKIQQLSLLLLVMVPHQHHTLYICHLIYLDYKSVTKHSYLSPTKELRINFISLTLHFQFHSYLIATLCLMLPNVEGSDVLAHGSICSFYFEMYVKHILKRQKKVLKNLHVYLHVLRAHKVVS
jgi:hypothetical protein